MTNILQNPSLDALEDVFQSCPGDCDVCLKVVTCLRVYASLDRYKRSRKQTVLSRWFRNNIKFLFGVYL